MGIISKLGSSCNDIILNRERKKRSSSYFIPRQPLLPLVKLTMYLSRLTPSCAALIHRSGSKTWGFGNTDASLLIRYVDWLTGVYGYVIVNM